MRTATLAVLAAALLVAPPPAAAKEKELARDSGTMEGRRSMAGSGHIVAFEKPEGKWRVRAVRIHGSRYGGGYDPAATFFTVAVTDEALKPLATARARYDLFPAGSFAWADVPLDRPVEVPARFKVVAAFDPTATKGVFVATALAKESHSSAGLPGGTERPFDAGKEWMIRVLLTDEAPEAGDEIELAVDDGQRTAERSLAGGGHAVEFRKPAGTWWIKSVRFCGRRYGGGYDPAETPFTVAVSATAMEPLHAEKAPYALVPADDFSWVEVSLTAAVKCPARFRAILDFDPTSTRGVYVGIAGTKGKASFAGRPGGPAERFADGEWMIRVVLSKKEPALPAPPPPPDRDAILRDFAFIADTVAAKFPAFAKKGVDWDAVRAEFRPRFQECPDEKAFTLLAHRLLARLGDSHSGVTRSRTEVHVPAFDGLYGAGMWIAADGGALVVRALSPGHPLAGRVPPGSVLLSVGGRPARVAHEEVRRRVREWCGWSSPHFLDARLSFQFFLFGEAETIPARFLVPGGAVEEVTLTRWGPGGRGLSRAAATMPEGVTSDGPVASAVLPDGLGYVRILAGMEDSTAAAFHRALEAVKGAKGLLLDCRGMGGGSDLPAWEMAGRLFEKAVPLGGRPLSPVGPWAFTGPVVMLQDEREISSAETFTWAVTETGRAVSVGRPTGGATIIPQVFEAPSGALSFRLGCFDRPTPIRAIHPEGAGTPPDVFVPYAASLLAGGADAEREAGLGILRALADGADREALVAAYGAALGGDPSRLPAASALLTSDEALRRRLGETVEALLRDTAAPLAAPENLAPGLAAALARLEGLAAVAEALGRDAAAKAARKTLEDLRAEVPAEREFAALLAGPLPPPPEAVERFCAAHAGRRFERAARQAWPPAGK